MDIIALGGNGGQIVLFHFKLEAEFGQEKTRAKPKHRVVSDL